MCWSEAFGDERHADQQQERQRQHLHRRMPVHERADRPGREHHHARPTMTTAAIITAQLVDHADRGDHRVEREHDVEQHDLDDHAGERGGDPLAAWPSSPSSLLVDLEGALAEQEQAADDQNQIAPGISCPSRVNSGAVSRDDPREREQQQDAREHRAEQADAPRPAAAPAAAFPTGSR